MDSSIVEKLKTEQEIKELRPAETRPGFEFKEKKEKELGKERKVREKRGDFSQEIEQIMRPGGVGAPGIDTQKSPLHQTVEEILEDGLGELYFSLPPKDQEKFKQSGEKTTSAIVKLIESGKVVFKKIFDLIRKWLHLIPGVSKFFVEQEAKIKADKIVEISNS